MVSMLFDRFLTDFLFYCTNSLGDSSSDKTYQKSPPVWEQEGDREN